MRLGSVHPLPVNATVSQFHQCGGFAVLISTNIKDLNEQLATLRKQCTSKEAEVERYKVEVEALRSGGLASSVP